MTDRFNFQRGRLLFEEGTDLSIFAEGQRSKSAEHSIYERSKSECLMKNENSQKIKKNEDLKR